MSKDSIQASIYNVWEQLFHYSLLKMTSLSEQERKSIVAHAFFENYHFKLLERYGKNKLEEDDKVVCRSLDTSKYPQFHPCEVSIALAFKKLPQ